MTEQYFTSRPSSGHEKKTVIFKIRDREYKFITDAGVFSKNHVDTGTRVLIKALEDERASRILDLGCGYGPIGIFMASRLPEAEVDMVDTNERATELCKENMDLNKVVNGKVFTGEGFSALPGKKYDLIATNPPIRAGKQVIYKMIADAYEWLLPAGRLYAVIRTNQGAKSLEAELKRIFGVVDEVEKESGFRVYRAVRQ